MGATATQRGGSRTRNGGGGGQRGRRDRDGSGDRRRKREIVKTMAFDSVGVRKYALQIQKASNGNPCLRIVEGTPKDDGSFRKFDLRIWSEDWPSFFEAMDQMRQFIERNNIRTPEGHRTPGAR